MSRGYGRIQQAIVALIANEPDGAWTTAHLCQHIYGSTAKKKKRRNAVLRALRTMRLPSELGKICWTIREARNAYCLVNDCSTESTLRHRYLDCDVSCGFDRWKDDCPHIVEMVTKEVLNRVAYQTASPLQKLDIDIARVQASMALFKMFGPNSKTIERIARHLSELQQQKAELEAGLKGRGMDRRRRKKQPRPLTPTSQAAWGSSTP
jgi:hypothetical protein